MGYLIFLHSFLHLIRNKFIPSDTKLFDPATEEKKLQRRFDIVVPLMPLSIDPDGCHMVLSLNYKVFKSFSAALCHRALSCFQDDFQDYK